MFLDVNLVKRISEDSIARKDFTWVFFFRMHGDGGYLVQLLSVLFHMQVNDYG